MRLARRAPNYHSPTHYLCFSGGKTYVSNGARLADLLGLPWLSVTDAESFKSGGLVKANYHKVLLMIHVSSLLMIYVWQVYSTRVYHSSLSMFGRCAR